MKRNEVMRKEREAGVGNERRRGLNTRYPELMMETMSSNNRKP
jgi:hypothetical protein